MNLLNKKIPFLPGNFDIKKLLDAGGVIAAVVGAMLALKVALGLGGGGGSSWNTPTPTPTRIYRRLIRQRTHLRLTQTRLSQYSPRLI